jgi:tRNA-dihydrouridine synthase B
MTEQVLNPHCYLKRPFKFGSLVLPSNIFCAPLAGCSDLAFRRMTAKYRPGLIFCEMVKMDALIRNDPHTYRLLDYEASMHPIGAQLCGSKPHFAGSCAKIIEDLGFDVIDLNCGCPVDKVTKDGSGSGLLKNPELIGEIISEMVAAVSIPVTVKIRAGWDMLNINAPEITLIAQQAGASAICIHGRTRSQAYKGPANWDYIKECKHLATHIQVIGNGDIFDVDSAARIFAHTGCDAVLLSRGTMGQPWLIDDIYCHLSGMPVPARTPLDYRDALLEHFEHIISYQPERKVVMDMRRVGCWYLKKGKGTRQLREWLNRSQSIQEIRGHIENFAWQDANFSETIPSELESCEVETC